MRPHINKVTLGEILVLEKPSHSGKVGVLYINFL